MERMQGKPETTIGLIDGPISTGPSRLGGGQDSRDSRETTVVPPLLDAWAAYEVLNGFEDEVRVTARIHSSTLFNRVFASPDLHS
jgi:hypothetical protein